MALLLIRVPEEGTLPLNEFFDYDGLCYASSAGRSTGTASVMELEDFYEATVRTEKLTDIPVVFVVRREESDVVAGWYRKAVVARKSAAVSLFLEGNVCAEISDALLLPEKERNYQLNCHFGDKLYEVVEPDDDRYDPLVEKMESYGGQNALIRYRDVDIRIEPKAKRDADLLRETCMGLAQDLMSDQCQDLVDIKRLETFAKRLTIVDGSSADGYYYEAMACHQLGHLRQGMKAIERALRMEPEAGDLMAMKANLLVSMQHIPEAARLFHAAYLEDGDQDYLIQEGRCLLIGGKMDQAYQVLKQVTDKQALTDAGINLKDIERRWPFINVRGLNFKHIFGLK